MRSDGVPVGTRVIVFHRHYGCDTGCCGHAIALAQKPDAYGLVDDEVLGTFAFDHPDSSDDIEWAQYFIRRELGADHVADLDWENCLLVDYC